MRLSAEDFAGWCAAHPGIGLSRTEVEQATAAHWPELTAAHGLSADLLVAVGALLGDPRALKLLRAEVRAAAGVATRNDGDDLLEEVSQELLTALVTAEQHASRLRSYRATGSLRSWLRTMAVRHALKLRKKHQQARGDSSNELLERVSSAHVSPELALFKARHRAQFAAIFSQALGTLEPRQRTMLKLKYLDQLTVQEIGRAYGLHHSNVVRTLQKTERELLDTVKRDFARQLKVSEEHVESAIDALVSGLSPDVWNGLG